jgi:hypothetical protein
VETRGRIILPPPQGCDLGEAYELTLLPYAIRWGASRFPAGLAPRMSAAWRREPLIGLAPWRA